LNKNRSKAQIGCPYCGATRSDETGWIDTDTPSEGRKLKIVTYGCNTELRLSKIGAKYQNNRFINKCSVELNA